MNALLKVIQRFQGGTDEVAVSEDKQKNLLVAAGNPGYLETRRRAEGWTVLTSAALQPLAAIPNSTPHLQLYNNGSRLAVVSDLHLWRFLGTPVGLGECIFAMITTAKAVPTLATQTLYSMSGKPSIIPTVTSEMVTALGDGVLANGWAPYGPAAAYLGTATPGTGFNVPVNGKLIIPPGCSLCLAVVASVATSSSFHVGPTFDWVEATVEA